MKITLKENKIKNDIEVIIEYPEMSETVNRIEHAVKSVDNIVRCYDDDGNICFVMFRALHIKPTDAGFRVKRIHNNILLGTLLGISVYFLAYGIELIIIAAMGKSPSLHFYVTSYSVDGNIGNQTGIWSRLCVVISTENAV